MKEIILIEENAQMKGVFTDLQLKVSDDHTVAAHSTKSIPVDFAFHPTTDIKDILFHWKLEAVLARAGLVLNGVETVDAHMVAVIVTNLSLKEVSIPEGSGIVGVSFSAKSMVKAVNQNNSKAVIDLNKGQRLTVGELA